MIRVRIRASSEVVKAGLESLLQNDPSLYILGGIEDKSAKDEIEDSQPDVVVAELESREDIQLQKC